MARKAARPCAYPGCPGLVRGSGRYCPDHAHLQQTQARASRERYEERTQRGSAAEQGYGREWTAIRDRFLREHPLCERCGRRAEVVHHRIPKREGGGDDPANLASLCQSCHMKVHGEGRVNL